MWKPPQRIKYESSAGEWPTASKAKESKMFSPIQCGPMHLKNRTWVPAMVPWRSNEQGEVTPEVLQWYARFAQGKPGAIVVEATGIRDIPSGPLLRIGDDRYIDGLEKLVKTVKDASDGQTQVLIQLIDFLTIRRRPNREKFLLQHLKIDSKLRGRLAAFDVDERAIRQYLLAQQDEELRWLLSPRNLENLEMGYRERVTDTHLPHIQDLPKILPNQFAEAALRAKKAGFDGVELHYAHAYTMASFLSAQNNRNDGYGSTLCNRIRLPLEVYHSVRNKVGTDFAVGCRYLSEESIEGGSTLEDAIYFGVEFAKAGMDFISLSRGGKFEDAKRPKEGWAAYPYTGPSGYECMPQYISDERGPFGRNIEPAAKIRQAIRAQQVDTPLVVAGGIHNFEQAEALLQKEQADIIGMARQSLADPDWVEKVRTGKGSEVRLCKYSNYCEGLDQKHKQVTCELWDRINLNEPGVELTDDKKRRLVAPQWDNLK